MYEISLTNMFDVYYLLYAVVIKGFVVESIDDFGYICELLKDQIIPIECPSKTLYRSM